MSYLTQCHILHILHSVTSHMLTKITNCPKSQCHTVSEIHGVTNCTVLNHTITMSQIIQSMSLPVSQITPCVTNHISSKFKLCTRQVTVVSQIPQKRSQKLTKESSSDNYICTIKHKSNLFVEKCW